LSSRGSNFNRSPIASQDQPLLRLPYELLRKNFRSAHTAAERDREGVKKLLRETATLSVNGRASKEDVLRNLDTMITRMRGMKRKLNSYADEEARLLRQTGSRIRLLAELDDIHTVDDVKYEAWSRARLDRLLVDYLLRHGYSGSAQALASAKDIHDLVDIETFIQMSKIQSSLRHGSVTEALVWCSENKKELRKMDVSIPSPSASRSSATRPIAMSPARDLACHQRRLLFLKKKMGF
jgi:macrophage erythroblast attacher